MQFRAPLLAFTVLSVWAGDAFAQVTCDPATFEASCNADGTIKVCDDVTNAAAPVEDNLDCTEAFGVANDGACAATFGCVGTCPPDALTCEVPLGGNCVGFGPLTDQDPNNNDAAGTVMCQGDATCQLNNDGTDTCVAHVGPQCSPGAESTCSGDIAVICLGDAAGTFSLTSNIAIDCALFNTTCGDTPCECDEQCGDGGTCTDGVCSGGQFCIFESDVTCPTGGGEGEGEGEGEDRTRDEPEPAPGGVPCSGFGSNATMPTFAGLALALVALRRRRR